MKIKVRVIDIDNEEKVLATFDHPNFNGGVFSLMSDQIILTECLKATPWETVGSVRIPEHHSGHLMLNPSHFLRQNTLIISAPYVQNSEGVWQEDKTQRARMFRITWEIRYDDNEPCVLDSF